VKLPFGGDAEFSAKAIHSARVPMTSMQCAHLRRHRCDGHVESLAKRSTDRTDGRKVDPTDTIPPGRPFLGGSRKTIEAMRDVHLFEP
jgi:hypothetical protein